ncbi:MAG: M3 family metallopeptidase [Burkholderiales bacterium]|nr:M3 family metallopeptidase [Burkholderiales bacterium]
MTDDNPLLATGALARFDLIRPAHVAPAVDALIAQARAAVERVAASPEPARWDNVAAPIAAALDRLDRAWSAVRHLNAVVSTPELRDAYNGNLPKVTALYTDLGQDERLYAKYKAIAASPAFASLDAAQRRVVDNELRDFRLGGAELPAGQKKRFMEVQEELASLSAKFDDNVLDAENAWALHVDDASRLRGIPADVLAAARAEAQAEGRPGWKLTLRMPCYVPVMQYADDRDLRARMHHGYSTLASDLGDDPAHDNSAIIERILALRDEEARLLGYANFGEVSLVPKMAGSPAEVIAFVRDLAVRARPFAERDFAELAAFARDELGIGDPQAWDFPYASEKLRQKRYAFSEQEVKQYFPQERVLAGLFGLVQTLYGVSIAPSQAPVWHPDVRFYDIRSRDGAIVGQFYLDLHAREGKQSGAWMDDAVNRRRDGGRLQHPVAFLTCNFAPPAVVDGRPQPSLLTHRDIVTMFHEFGHGLHLLLTRVDVPGVSGIEGVEWDAVELPSQIMENWCWERDVLESMSAHVRTGEKLPRPLFERMVAAKNFQSGLGTLRQVEFALFDMLLHTEYLPGRRGPHADAQAVLAAVRREVAVVPRPDYDRFMHAFGHIFAGGYAAGYYSYKWAEVLSADAFSLFEEVGVLSPEAGARFRDEVLARGGSRPALESFVAFRGRPPQIDALLRHNGMTTSS